jgi:hypothetical protein
VDEPDQIEPDGALFAALLFGDVWPERIFPGVDADGEEEVTPARGALSRGLRALAMGRADGTTLDGVDAEEFAPGERAWYWALRSLEAEGQELYVQGAHFWQAAQEEAEDGWQRADLEEFRANVLLRSQPATEALGERLRAKWQSYAWDLEGIPALRRYALLLLRLGRGEEAAELLAQQRARLGESAREQIHGLLLLEAMLFPFPTDSERASLLQILREGGTELHEGAALWLLLSRAEGEEGRRFLLKFLSELPESAATFLEGRLRARLQLALLLGEDRQAQQLALRLLQDYPNSPLRPSLERLWVSRAIQSGQTDYGELAKILRDMGREGPSSPIGRSLALAFARHFLESGDASLAERLLGEFLDGETQSDGHELRIRALLQLERYESAWEFFQKLPHPTSEFFLACNNAFMGSELRAEWDGCMGEFFRKNAPSWAEDVRLPFLLRLAGNALELGNCESAEAFLGEMGDYWEGICGERFGAEVALLRLRLRLAAGGDGSWERQDLCSRWPHSPEAQDAFFLCADRWEELQQPQRAAREMEEFLSRYGGDGRSPRIPQALHRLGALKLEEEPEAARELFGRLQRAYPHSIQAFWAGMGEGDLLRERGEFAAAAAVFQNLLSQFPDSPSRVFAELALAKCHLALAASRAGEHLPAAIALLERLSAGALDNLNLRLEIDYTLASALQRAGDGVRAQLLRWRCWQFCALIRENWERLNADGQFWLRGIVRDLLDSLDPDADGEAIESIRGALVLDWEGP